MSIECGGTLGDVSQTERASAVTLPSGVLPAKQKEAWLAVETYMRANPTALIKQACEATGVTYGNYYAAKKKLEQGPMSFSDSDRIRPGDKILERALDDEEEIPMPEGVDDGYDQAVKDANAEAGTVEEVSADEVLSNVLAWLRQLPEGDQRRTLDACRVALGHAVAVDRLFVTGRGEHPVLPPAVKCYREGACAKLSHHSCETRGCIYGVGT